MYLSTSVTDSPRYLIITDPLHINQVSLWAALFGIGLCILQHHYWSVYPEGGVMMCSVLSHFPSLWPHSCLIRMRTLWFMMNNVCFLFLRRIHDVMMSGESKIHIHLTACQNVGPHNSLTDPDVLEARLTTRVATCHRHRCYSTPFQPVAHVLHAFTWE